MKHGYIAPSHRDGARKIDKTWSFVAAKLNCGIAAKENLQNESQVHKSKNRRTYCEELRLNDPIVWQACDQLD